MCYRFYTQPVIRFCMRDCVSPMSSKNDKCVNIFSVNFELSSDSAKGPLSRTEILCRNSTQPKSPDLKLMRYCSYFPAFKADRYILTSICDSERKKERKK